jgi:putative aldouronate transport system permease protein
MLMYRSLSRKIFEVFLYIGFTLFCLLVILPFLNVIAISLSSKKAYFSGKVMFWPVDWYTTGYRIILSSKVFLTSLRNTVFISIVNTGLCILVALSAGYALANKKFFGRRVAFVFLLIPMYFSGGLIPYYLIVNGYGLNNNMGALIFPHLVSIFYIIVFRNAINQLPKEVMESAEIDGASEFTTLFRIVVHLILPMVMAFTIFSAVGYWNMWFDVMIFIRDKWKWTLQYMLRDIYTNPGISGGGLTGGDFIDDPTTLLPQNIIMSSIICTVLPIIVIYPFLQKYFIHGVIVGAVKG